MDTSYLISYLQHNKNVRNDQTVQAYEVINRLKYKGYKMRISEISLGELITVSMNKSTAGVNLEDLEILKSIIEKNEFEIYRLDRGRLGRFTDLVSRLKKDRKIDPTDVLILAYSMADKESKGLLTFDNKMIGSKIVTDVRKENLRDRKGFVVTNDPFSHQGSFP
ncbi:MAG: PIN domain-containing protein [Thaumarchaeota archaeon]|nr:PIN domain-containing protein [Nitrososphaerota archaeon]